MEVKQVKSTHCEIPLPPRAVVKLYENLFYTLLPNTPLTLSTPFTRRRPSSGDKLLAGSDPNYRNDDVSGDASYGVDGLEVGDYVLKLASTPRVYWYSIRWWKYGTKEEVLNGGGDECKLDARAVRFGRGPHEAIKVDSAAHEVVLFQCRE